MTTAHSTPVITREIATKVRDIVGAGLVNGVGIAEPGKLYVSRELADEMLAALYSVVNSAPIKPRRIDRALSLVMVSRAIVAAEAAGL
jgi:hypothetical protein